MSLRSDMTRFYAHRGLHNERLPENSLPAFSRAVEMGYGIELDVLKTADDKLVVFHDDILKRMCGVKGRVTEKTYEQLKELKLLESQEVIPLFQEVLDLVKGQVPLLVEIKSEGDWKKTTDLVAEMMEQYSGQYVVESFSSLVLMKYKKRLPKVGRGQLATDLFRGKKKQSVITKWLLSKMLLNVLTKPDFIAYNYKYRDSKYFQKVKKNPQMLFAAWTVRSEEEYDQIKEEFDSFIFEGFLPKR